MKCGDCKFSETLTAEKGETDLAKLVKTTLVCKRMPPSVSVFPVGQNAQGLVMGQAVNWPQVAGDWYCHEFRSKEVLQ